MRRLNVWKRLGIVLSVLWAVFAFSYTWITEENRAQKFAGATAEICEEGKRQNHQGVDDCWNKVFVDNLRVMEATMANDAIFIALVPIPFFWLIAWAITGTARWVLRGRDVTAT